jgi:hypothetical protein
MKLAKKTRDKAARFVGRVKDQFDRPPRGSTPEPPSAVSVDTPQPGNPTPTALVPLLFSDPCFPAETGPAVTSQSSITIPAPLIASPSNLPLNLAARKDLLDPALASSAIQHSGQSTANMAWAGLKNLARVLSRGVDEFGPLRSAVEAFSGCLEIYEVRILPSPV